MSETKRIAKLNKATQNGKPWHGSNINEILNGITADQAFQKPIANAHSIWEIVWHIINWRLFTIEKLKNNEAFEIVLNTSMDWSTIEDNSEDNWKNTLSKLLETSNELSTLIDGMNEAKLETTIPGKKYNYYTLLHGIVHHDIHHVGQITILKKLIVINKK